MKNVVQSSALEYLISSAKCYPDRVAIREGEKQLTFAELATLGAGVALGLGKAVYNQPVLVYLPKSSMAVAAFAGILAAGGFYVPLDIEAPLARKLQILEVLSSPAVVSSREFASELKALAISNVLFIEDVVLEGTLSSPPAQIDTEPCYVIFTSGSSGVPKGVVISHRGVNDYIDWAIASLGSCADDVIGSQAPFYFDNSTLDIYLSWATGACLEIIPEKVFIFPRDLVEHLHTRGVTWVFFVPSVMINIAKLEAFSDTPLKLRMVAFAGEVMPTWVLSYWQQMLPDCRFVNLYGPTEITVDCTWYEVLRQYRPDEVLPIGYPCHNTNILIVSEEDTACKNGEVGELCVRGSSLALGYYNDLDRSSLAFQQNPLESRYYDRIYRTGDLVWRRDDGALMFVGRKDFQIKHNGYRIELGEIEVAAAAHPSVANCAALYDVSRSLLALTFEASHDISAQDWREFLQEIIPSYMIPQYFIRLSDLPLNRNGKINRPLLMAETISQIVS